MTFPITARRLVLRAFEERDASDFARYRSEPAVARYQSWDAPYTLDQARSFIAAMRGAVPGAPGAWFQAAIQLREAGIQEVVDVVGIEHVDDLVGDVGFHVLAEDPRQAEIGFTLAPDYQGLGFAGEAVAALLAYLFDELKLHRVRANCDPRNVASARLLLRQGFRHEGRCIDSLWFKGEWASEDWFALLHREWQARAPK